MCGCDNLTYYNDSLAAAAGVSVNASGACAGPTATACKTQGPGQAAVKCPTGSKCDLVVAQCQVTIGGIPGTCWVLPKTCAADEPTPYRACGQIGTTGKCLGLCELIDSEKAFAKDADNCK